MHNLSCIFPRIILCFSLLNFLCNVHYTTMQKKYSPKVYSIAKPLICLYNFIPLYHIFHYSVNLHFYFSINFVTSSKKTSKYAKFFQHIGHFFTTHIAIFAKKSTLKGGFYGILYYDFFSVIFCTFIHCKKCMHSVLNIKR